jgi:hypothetical protein
LNPADTPLLLIAWRRPHTLRQVIDAIRPVAPTRLFVACDGPNPERPGEAEKIAATREVIETEIDWPCQIERLYSDVNQGCRLGVSRAISWFFEHVEEGIILEDDCLPNTDFFLFCTELLDRYRFDTRIWSISGSNWQNGHWRGDSTYYFSRFNHSWGWATWRRCWTHYQGIEKKWPIIRDTGLLQNLAEDAFEWSHFSSTYDLIYKTNNPHIWDYWWSLVIMTNGGLTAIPNKNLIRNVGFDSDATHTSSMTNSADPCSMFVIECTSMVYDLPKPIVHPSLIVRSRDAEIFELDFRMGRAYSRHNKTFLSRLKRLTKSTICMLTKPRRIPSSSPKNY